jgi:hypothetical protein
MYAILESDEAWSLMTTVVAALLDNAELSDEGKAAIKEWRSDRADGTVEMDELTDELNETLNGALEEKFTRRVRRKGRYASTREG